MRAPAVSTTILALVVSACTQGSDGDMPIAQVMDSASIRVLTYSALNAPPASVVLDSVPLFRVGWDPEGRLFERIEDATVLANGRVAVLDGKGTQEIVILEADGSVVQVLGGHGEGPGEFTGLQRVVATEHGLIAQDAMEARATAYNSGMDLAGTYSLPYLDHKAILGATGDSFILGPPLMMVRGRLYPEPWRRVALTTSAPPFEAEDTVAVVDWEQSLNFNGRDPWAASGRAAFDGERVIYGRGDRPELIWYDLDGSPVQIVRWVSPPEAVTDSAYAEFEEDWLRLVGDGMSPSVTREFIEDMALQHQGFSPYFDQIFVDDEGTVWLGAFLRSEQRSESFERPFFLFSRHGELLGTISLPAELRVLDITTDAVVGYELGRFNEPALVAYSILRN